MFERESRGTEEPSLILASNVTIPEAPPFEVERPALVDEVGRATLTIVTGPAGSGKTQLVASWARRHAGRGPIAWVTVDDGVQAQAFWSYVVAAIRRAEPLFPEVTPGAAESVGRAELGRIAGLLAGLPRTVTLVLDGVSLLAGSRWATDLDFVVRHSGRRLRVAVAGRWDPPLPVHRYRVAGDLVEIRGDDLAFTAAEAQRLLALHDVVLGQQALRGLLDRTEGWAAGLRLCARLLQGVPRADADRAAAAISGRDATIAEYFLGEVLCVQTPEARRFLLETSVLDDFSPGLAEVVTRCADARQMLATLSRENTFLRSDGEGAGTYRYHLLFAELLRAQLAWEDPGRPKRLRLRAATWLAEQGAVAEAAGYAARSGEFAEAAAVVVEDYAVGQLFAGGVRGRLGQVFRTPTDEDSPELMVVRAALGIVDGRADVAEALLSKLSGTIAGTSVGCGDALRLARLLVESHPALDAPLDAVSAAIQEAETLLAVVPPDRAARHPELATLLLANKAAVQSRVGAVGTAAEMLTDAIASAQPGCEPVVVDCLGRLALLEAYGGRLHRADTLARQALARADEHGLGPRTPVAARLALAWVTVERYDIEAADRHLRACQRYCRAGAEAAAVSAYAIVRSRRLQARGEMRGALQTLRDAEAATPDAPAWLACENGLSSARILTTMGRPVDAAAALSAYGMLDFADVTVVRAGILLAAGDAERAARAARAVAEQTAVSVPAQIEAWLLLARAADDLPAAREALHRALDTAAIEGHRRILHQAWKPLRRVLREDDELIGQYQALGTLAEPSARGAAVRETDPVLVESLSKRELEVLRAMAAMLPTEEIAASMFVSINTVKTHVRSILRKLSASRRNEAVRRARSLNLV